MRRGARRGGGGKEEDEGGEEDEEEEWVSNVRMKKDMRMRRRRKGT